MTSGKVRCLSVYMSDCITSGKVRCLSVHLADCITSGKVRCLSVYLSDCITSGKVLCLSVYLSDSIISFIPTPHPFELEIFGQELPFFSQLPALVYLEQGSKSHIYQTCLIRFVFYGT